MRIRAEIFEMIDRERESQIKKHGEWIRFEEDWVVRLTKRLGEVAATLVANQSDQAFVREVVQLAAVAVACLEEKA